MTLYVGDRSFNNTSRFPDGKITEQGQDHTNRVGRCCRAGVFCLCSHRRPGGPTHAIEMVFFMSKLQREVGNLIYSYLGRFDIKENHRPEWLRTAKGGRLELDFFIEELDVAIEVQGDQHYQFSSLFHQSYDDFKDLLTRDRLKAKICAERGIKLYEVSSESNMIEILPEIDSDIILPFHPKALEQINITSGTYLHPKTIKKHLRRLHKFISKEGISERRIRRAISSFNAIRQYQEVKDITIPFTNAEIDMLTAASKKCVTASGHRH